MEIQRLDKNILFGAFAKACSDFGDEGGNVGSGECFADDIGIGCPFDNEDEDLLCSIIRPNHWREVFEKKEDQKPEPLPEFQFGDKVTVRLGSPTEGIFNMYVDDHGIIRASVLFEGSECCEEVAVNDLKAGWHD